MSKYENRLDVVVQRIEVLRIFIPQDSINSRPRTITVDEMTAGELARQIAGTISQAAAIAR